MEDQITSTKRRPRINVLKALKTAAPTANVQVRRCCVCGCMNPIGDGIDASHTVVLDGVAHALYTCADNGGCLYQAGLLKDRLEFCEAEMPPQGTISIDEALARLRHPPTGELVPYSECLATLSEFFREEESRQLVGSET